MKNLKKLLSIILVASMLFTSNAAWTFAESVNEVETTTAEIEINADEETHTDESMSELADEETETSWTGENSPLDCSPLAEPEEEEFVELDEEESEYEETESVEANETTVVEEETTVGAQFSEPALKDESQNIASISEIEEVLDENISTVSEAEVEIKSKKNLDINNNLYGWDNEVPGDYWGNHKWEDHSPMSINIAHANNQEQPFGDLLVRWTLTGDWSKNQFSRSDTQDLIENVAPMGKKFDGFYQMKESYTSKDEFYEDYDYTKDYTESLSGLYSVSSLYSSVKDWETEVPKYYGVVYDDALTIKYIDNPPRDYYMEDDSRIRNSFDRWDLYQYVGEHTPEKREYCFRGGYLDSDEGNPITAKHYENDNKVTLIGWNTKQDGSGDFYKFGEFIPDETPFTNNNLTLFGVWENSANVKRVKYDANIDWESGYMAPPFNDSVTGDTTTKPIVVTGENVKAVKPNELKEKKLLKWNTQADGNGTDYEIGATISDYSTAAGFDADGVLKLYAVWGEPTDMTFSIIYDQNIPTGWTLQGTWNITDTINSPLPITLANSNGLKIKEDSTGKIKHLVSWLDKSKSRTYSLAEVIPADEFVIMDLFESKSSVTLSAVWDEKEDVPYMYWTLGSDRVMHFYSEAADGRNAISFNSDKEIEYKEGEDTLNLNIVKSVVFEEKIDATTAAGLFKGFTNLDSISGFDNFNMSYVKNCKKMFEGCSKLETIDLRTFDTSSVTNMDRMFYNCSGLVTIFATDSFDTTNVTSSEDMFTGCSNIEGGEGTKYDESKVTVTYACIDEGTSKPGYFSSSPASRSTFDPSGTPKLYVLGYDGANKYIHPVGKSSDNTPLVQVMNNLEKPEESVTILGFYPIISSEKDAQGHRVFTSEDAMKNKYATEGITTYLSADEFVAEYLSYSAISEVYDIYYGAVYDKYVTKITGAENIDIPTIDGLSYFRAGEKLDISGVTIAVEYSDGSTNDISYDSINFSVIPETFSKGDKSVILKYKNVEYTLSDNVYVYDNDYDAYSISNVNPLPDKTVYVEGEKFDPRGLKVAVGKVFSSGTAVESVNYNGNESRFVISDTPLVAGATTFTIQYGEYSGCTYNVPIEVVRKGQSATIAGTAAKNYYNNDDTLSEDNLNGISVTVNYQTDPISVTYTYPTDKKYFTFNPEIGSKLSPNDNNITISVAGVNVDYPIVVLPDGAPTSSKKDKDPDKTQYESGDLFDPTGLKINVTYTGGITKTVEYNDETKNDFAFEPNPFATPDPEPLKYGDTDVKISFRGSPQASYPVTVRRKIDTISYESGPDTKVYSKGDKFDPTGLVVHVTYVGGGEEDIPYDNTTASVFKFNPEIDHVFDDSDIGNKVQVGFGNSAYVTIDMMDDIYPESFTFIDYDPKTDSVYVTPNPDAATETASVRGIFEEMINTALANGATGFHEYNANGVNDSKNKYNKYTPATMNKEEALARFDKYIADGATGNLFIGPSFKKPEPAPDPKPNPSNYGSGSDNSGSDSSSSTSGPINPPNKNLDVINSFNSIPQGNLYNDVHFYDSLKLIPENMIAPKINIIDDKGNTGFGQWLIGRERAEWYVLSGDLNANGTKGSAGFLKNTWCKLKWNGVENWFHFGNDAKMTIGWYREGDKIYFLQNDLNDKQYGRLLTGIQNVGGITYDFGRDGAAKNTTDFNVGGGYVAGSIIPGAGQRYISPVDQLSKLEYNYELSNKMNDNN